jgi:hypothetical protein
MFLNSKTTKGRWRILELQRIIEYILVFFGGIRVTRKRRLKILIALDSLNI